MPPRRVDKMEVRNKQVADDEMMRWCDVADQTFKFRKVQNNIFWTKKLKSEGTSG